MEPEVEGAPLLEASEWSDLSLVNYSGGKDSMCMLGKLRDEYPHVETVCVTADTGFEHQKPISAVEWLRLRGNTLPSEAMAISFSKEALMRTVDFCRGDLVTLKHAGRPNGISAAG